MKKINIDKFIEWENEIKKTDSFLDIGCWSGATVLRLSSKCDSYGADFNKDTLALADEKIKSNLVFCDITKNKPFDKKFDWILMSEVIEHIKEEDKTIENISKSLKKGGKLILTTPRSVRFFEFWDPAWVRWKFGGKERHYHFTLGELGKRLSKHGLKIIKYSIRGNFLWIIKRWINVFLQYLFKLNIKIPNKWNDGFTDWMILAEKI